MGRGCTNSGAVSSTGLVYPIEGEIGAYCYAGGIAGRISKSYVAMLDNENTGNVSAQSENTVQKIYTGDIYGVAGSQ